MNQLTIVVTKRAGIHALRHAFRVEGL